MIYLLTAVGQPPGGSSTVHIYTQTIHRTTQNKQYTERHKKFGRVLTVPHLCGFYPGICLTTEEKAWKNLSQSSQRVPAGKMLKVKYGLVDSYRIRFFFYKKFWLDIPCLLYRTPKIITMFIRNRHQPASGIELIQSRHIMFF